MKDQDAQHVACDASHYHTGLTLPHQGRHSSSPLSEGQTVEVMGKFKSASREEAWGFRRRAWTELSHCSSCAITGLLAFCEAWAMEPVVGAGLSSERGTLRDNPLASSFVAGVAPSKADVMPSHEDDSSQGLRC